jgi:SAM-dependent methyltransferase
MKLNRTYWEERYKKEEIGWDCGAITTPLKEYIDQLTNTALKILIPGAGNGYEFEYLIQKGFTNVYVVDYAPTPIQNLKEKLPQVAEEHFIQRDFFEIENQFDLIIEQTFFCALDVELRTKYVEKMHSLLRPNGKLTGLLFQFPLTEVGPPFGGSFDEYQQLFINDFHLKKMETAYNSIKPRKGNELFFIFTKK